MHYFISYLQFILHINEHLPYLFQTYGNWIYAAVFLIIFLESGLILTPFLPGESLLFALGAVTAAGGVSPVFMILLLVFAAILGGFLNYALGFWAGEHILQKLTVNFVQKGMEKTDVFYKKHGAKAVLIARLIPIVRSFVPFFAGVAKMRFGLFALFNLLGGFIWISLFIAIGFYFGSISMVQEHFSWFVLAIIILSIVPITIEVLKSFRKKDYVQPL